MRGEAEDKIKDAVQWCTDHLHGSPLGHACGLRGFEEIKTAAITGQVLFGGALHQLRLNSQAMEESTDFGRIAKFLEKIFVVKDLHLGIGHVKVNLDQAPPQGIEPNSLLRADKDAEIVGACLVVSAHRADAPVLEELREAMLDLVFDGRNMGSGSTFWCHKLKFVEAEEAARDVLGMSCRRKCLLLCKLVDQAKTEKIRGADVKDAVDADILRKVLEINQFDVKKTWNQETSRRYLSLGRRIADVRFTSLLDLWEYHEARYALVDGIAVLRGLAAATSDNDELYWILKTLFLEQRSGMRSKLVGSETSVKAKALLLRRAAMMHMHQSMFPKFSAEIKELMDWKYYKEYRNCEETGKTIGELQPEPEEGAEDEELDDEPGEAFAGLTSYTSRLPLLQLCKKLMRNTMERTFMSMVREQEKDTRGAAGVQLNLTMASAQPLVRSFNLIETAYKADFAPEANAAAKAAAQADASSTIVHADGGMSATIVVSNRIADDREYKQRLEEWNQRVADHMDQEYKNYVTNRVTLVVEDPSGNSDAAVKKLQKLPVVASERKRKWYVYDEHVARPFDWATCKRLRRTIFHPTETDFEGGDLDGMLEVYSKTRTVIDDACHDLLTVLLPAAPPNAEVNKGVAAAVAKLRQLIPRHQKPKIGVIEKSHVDVLRQTKERTAFAGNVDSSAVFTTQAPLGLARKAMVFCEGDTYFNRWRVKVHPFAQLARCTEEQGNKLWSDVSKQVRFLNDDDVPHEEAMADEASMKQGEIVPYPHEISMQLAQEFIRIFGIELAIVFKVGSGVSLQACIERNIRAIGFVETKEHRAFVFDNLVQWVKAQRLVPAESAPKKPAELIAYERGMATPKPDTNKTPVVVPPDTAVALAPAAATATVVPGAPPIVPPAVLGTQQRASTKGFGSVVL